MGKYNRTYVEMSCPRCGHRGVFDVDVYVGETHDMLDVNIGDAYPSTSRNEEGEGYAECSECHHDFFCVARVIDFKLASVEPDLARTAYIPDEVVGGRPCPTCGKGSVFKCSATEASPTCSVKRRAASASSTMSASTELCATGTMGSRGHGRKPEAGSARFPRPRLTP